MFAVTPAAATTGGQWLKSLGVDHRRPGGVPPLSAYAYQRSVSLPLAGKGRQHLTPARGVEQGSVRRKSARPSAEAEQHHPAHRVAELRAGLRIGGDAAWIVVGGAGDQPRAEPPEQPLACRVAGRAIPGDAGPPARGARRGWHLRPSFRRRRLGLHQAAHAHPLAYFPAALAMPARSCHAEDDTVRTSPTSPIGTGFYKFSLTEGRRNKGLA